MMISASQRIVLVSLRVVLVALLVIVACYAVAALMFFAWVQPIVLAHVAGALLIVFTALLATYSKSLRDLLSAIPPALLGAFLFLFSSLIYDKVRLELSRPHLPTIVSDILEDPRACPGKCYVDPADPPVVFVVRGGFLGDEWGVCFDPGGKISTPRDSRVLLHYGDGAPDGVIHLRNDAMTYARLRRDWYSCGIG
ncbi:MAG: hypothetical protein PVI23_14395 [Maricaulaceae bacterium]|jgi:hypothetical protein